MTSDSQKSSALPRQNNDGAAKPGNLESRAREAASKAKTLAEFRKALGIPHDQAMALNERLGLGVPNDADGNWQPLGEVVREIADEVLSTQETPKRAAE